MLFATLTGNINIILNALTVVVLVVASVFATRSKIKRDNYNDLKERVDILEREREESRMQHQESVKAIANLEGQLKTYKEIPLKQIADTLTELSTSNSQILMTLKNSALIAANELKHTTTEKTVINAKA